MYQRLDKTFFQEPKELAGLIKTSNLIQTFLPRQIYIDKVLKIIERKVLKGTHLPVTIKEIQAGYLVNPYFKDIYPYIVQNKMGNTKTTIQKVEALAEKIYIVRFTII